MDKFNIEMPDDLEMKSQINLILDKGLESKESFYSYMKEMYQRIGFKNLFHDLSELTFIGVLLVSLLMYGILAIRGDFTLSRERIYTFIFIGSPLYYLATNVFSLINVKENNTYDIEMVCKYNFYQISALRMLAFSVISILLSTVFVLGLYNKINLLRGIMISITSIFLFSALLLYSMTKIKHYIGRYMVIGGWILGNGLLLRLSSNKYFEFLQSMPMAVYIVVTVISVCVYLKNVKILSNYNKVEQINFRGI
ncbi:MAG: hypothetical protein RSG52_00665 [Terrisporobacter sp.]|uniref:hypothetical protein n=1 Tax=Terrisporobacter sp. TaxID=1965305 RepID=UPI002FCA4F02